MRGEGRGRRRNNTRGPRHGKGRESRSPVRRYGYLNFFMNFETILHLEFVRAMHSALFAHFAAASVSPSFVIQSTRVSCAGLPKQTRLRFAQLLLCTENASRSSPCMPWPKITFENEGRLTFICDTIRKSSPPPPPPLKRVFSRSSRWIQILARRVGRRRGRLRFIQVAVRPSVVVAKSSSPSFQVLHCYECVVVGRHRRRPQP